MELIQISLIPSWKCIMYHASYVLGILLLDYQICTCNSFLNLSFCIEDIYRCEYAQTHSEL
jgi:hypothetical protein